MITHRHPLAGGGPGSQREILSLHYGPAIGAGKAVIQAALHADEVPALLVAHHLRAGLAALEAQGRLLGEIVLVPYANPIGLAQRYLHQPMGRFELGSGENFNRHYADVSAHALERLSWPIAATPAGRVAQLRLALREACAELPADTELKSLRKTLLGLAIDADLVLDLHCDNEAVMHLYTATVHAAEVEPLARLLGAHATLLADASGDEPFDEACSTIWGRLRTRLAEREGRAVEVPDACIAVTVELRGETDVDHVLATRDAAAILDYLCLRGLVAGPSPTLPAALHPATPLAGSMPVTAPHAGVVVYRRGLGEFVRAGDPLADLVDPASGNVSALTSPVDGVFYAREIRRFVPGGTRFAKVAGREAVRSGRLLSE